MAEEGTVSARLREWSIGVFRSVTNVGEYISTCMRVCLSVLYVGEDILACVHPYILYRVGVSTGVSTGSCIL